MIALRVTCCMLFALGVGACAVPQLHSGNSLAEVLNFDGPQAPQTLQVPASNSAREHEARCRQLTNAAIWDDPERPVMRPVMEEKGCWPPVR